MDVCLGLDEDEPLEVGLSEPLEVGFSEPLDNGSLATYDHLLYSALSSLGKVLTHCSRALTEIKHTTLLKEIFGERVAVFKLMLFRLV